MVCGESRSNTNCHSWWPSLCTWRIRCTTTIIRLNCGTLCHYMDKVWYTYTLYIYLIYEYTPRYCSLRTKEAKRDDKYYKKQIKQTFIIWWYLSFILIYICVCITCMYVCMYVYELKEIIYNIKDHITIYKWK